MTVAAELLALRGADGLIRPDRVLEWAKRNRKSRIASQLEWDDDAAAELHRLTQVRQLIAVHIVDSEGWRTEISLSIDRPTGGGYRNVDAILSNETLAAVMLQDAL